MSVVAALLVAAPLVAAAVELIARSKPTRSGMAAVLGASSALGTSIVLAIRVGLVGPVTVGPAAAPVVRVDMLGAAVALVVSFIGLTVLTYARRQLDGFERSRLASAGSVALASTLLTATAGRLTVLALAWIATTAAIVAIVHRGDVQARRVAARRVLVINSVGDASLAIAALITISVVGDVALTDFSVVIEELGSRTMPGFSGLTVLDLVAVLLVVAALARASQLPFRSWILSTLAAPTPTSALLHAGVVNGGAIVLLRAGAVASSALAAWLLALASVSTVLVWSAVAAARRDVKGVLASSTSAQMAFMLLAVAVGAPAAAIAHLMGHALYKSARFLGVGEAIAAEVRRRRATRPASRGSAAVFGLLVACVVAASTTVLLHDADAWVTGSSLAATAGLGVWALGRRAADRAELAWLSASSLGVALTYVLLAAGLEQLSATALTGSSTAVPPPLALAVLAAGLVLTRVGLSTPRFSARLTGLLGGVGRPTVPAMPRRGTQPSVTEPVSVPSSLGATP